MPEYPSSRPTAGYTPLTLLSSLSQGYSAPPEGIDPELAAAMRVQYVSLLNEIEIAEKHLQMETVETFGQMKAAEINARASILQAMASGAAASAEAQKAKAEMITGLMGSYAEKASNIVFLNPPEALTTYQRELKIGWEAIETHRASGGFGAPVSPGGDSGQAKKELHTQVGLIQDQMGFKTLMAGAEVIWAGHSADMTATEKGIYAERVLTDTTGTLIAALTANNPELSETEEGSALILAVASTAMAQNEMFALFNQRVAEAAPLIEEEQAKAEDLFVYMTDEISKVGAGLDKKAVSDAVRAMDELGDVLEGGPEEFAKGIMAQPSGLDGTSITKGMVDRELKRIDQLENPDDPLVAAVNKMRSVNGFDEWAHAMGFNSITRAAVYAGNHPYELNYGLSLYRDGMTDPEEMRDALRSKSIEDGGGFFVSPIGRLLSPLSGRRRPGGMSGLGARIQKFRQFAESYTPRGAVTDVDDEQTLDGEHEFELDVKRVLPASPEVEAAQAKFESELEDEDAWTHDEWRIPELSQNKEELLNSLKEEGLVTDEYLAALGDEVLPIGSILRDLIETNPDNAIAISEWMGAKGLSLPPPSADPDSTVDSHLATELRSEDGRITDTEYLEWLWNEPGLSTYEDAQGGRYAQTSDGNWVVVGTENLEEQGTIIEADTPRYLALMGEMAKNSGGTRTADAKAASAKAEAERRAEAARKRAAAAKAAEEEAKAAEEEAAKAEKPKTDREQYGPEGLGASPPSPSGSDKKKVSYPSANLGSPYSGVSYPTN